MSDDESEFILFIVQLYNIVITFTTDNVTLNDVSFLCVLVDVDIYVVPQPIKQFTASIIAECAVMSL